MNCNALKQSHAIFLETILCYILMVLIIVIVIINCFNTNSKLPRRKRRR
jgi:t-SNARE complex subunit (syntaxin)